MSYAQHPAQPPKRKRRPARLFLAVLAAVGLLVVIVALASSGGGDPARTSSGAPTVGAVPTPTPTPDPEPAGPLSTFGAGTYEVGTGDGQVAPGKYKTTGPDDGAPSCYWARLKNLEGDLSSITANNNAEGPTVVTISPKDAAFQTGCEWVKS
jgi:hypothetical protein